MNKKVLFLLIAIASFSVVAYALTRKQGEREPITIKSHGSYITMSLDDLINKSDLIVIGNLKSVVASRWNTPDGRRPEGNPAKVITPEMVIFTDMNFSVAQSLKGNIQKNIVRIRTLGGELEGDKMIVDDFVPQSNKKYLLFLTLDTAGSTAKIAPGYYWITGGGFQGMYEIVADRAFSTMDAWTLEDLITYIQNKLQSSQ